MIAILAPGGRAGGASPHCMSDSFRTTCGGALDGVGSWPGAIVTARKASAARPAVLRIGVLLRGCYPLRTRTVIPPGIVLRMSTEYRPPRAFGVALSGAAGGTMAKISRLGALALAVAFAGGGILEAQALVTSPTPL